VHRLSIAIFFLMFAEQIGRFAHLWCIFARAFACAAPIVARECRRVTIVRFQEQINGRQYTIEVSPVARNRWRAQIARRPGATTALMPFYGTTPDEAAKLLSGWLKAANQ
jgi:hypothetical protein